MDNNTETKSETTSPVTTDNKLTKIHPLTAAAAVAVILVSITGIAAMTGMLPNANKSPDSSTDSASASQVAQSNAPSTGATKNSSSKNSPMVAGNGSSGSS